ncbi:MAG: zinc ribbon domain-containing protein [Phycisphaeraceae bacterium]|nr:zinc ribbon domain-containing protein [Phycisphaeraceae bacterium]
MPIYEYECSGCGHVTEQLRRMSDADGKVACEACGSRKTHRKHSVFSACGCDTAGGASAGASASSATHGAGCPCCHGGGGGACGL